MPVNDRFDGQWVLTPCSDPAETHNGKNSPFPWVEISNGAGEVSFFCRGGADAEWLSRRLNGRRVVRDLVNSYVDALLAARHYREKFGSGHELTRGHAKKAKLLRDKLSSKLGVSL